MSAAESELSRWPDFATASIRTQSILSNVAYRSSSATVCRAPSTAARWGAFLLLLMTGSRCCSRAAPAAGCTSGRLGSRADRSCTLHHDLAAVRLTSMSGAGTFCGVNLRTDLREKTVADALRERVVAITTDQTLEEAARTMLDRGVTALAVIDVDSRDPGIITERDLGRALVSDTDPRERPVGDFLTKDVIAATSDWSLDRAARTMNAGHIRHLMVVEDDHKVIGILSIS